MKSSFAVGKVVNGQMMVTTADGTGYVRPIVRPKPVLKLVENKVEPQRKVIVSVSEPLAEEVYQANLMPWMQRWMEQKQLTEQRQKKEARRNKTLVARRIFKYIKEELWF